MLGRIVDQLRKVDMDELDVRVHYQGRLTLCEAYLQDRKVVVDASIPDETARAIRERLGAVMGSIDPLTQHDDMAAGGTARARRAVEQRQKQVRGGERRGAMGRDGEEREKQVRDEGRGGEGNRRDSAWSHGTSSCCVAQATCLILS